jgi:hypothetical protein
MEVARMRGLVIAVVAVLLAACGQDGGDGTEGASPGVSPSPCPSVTPSGSPAASPTGPCVILGTTGSLDVQALTGTGTYTFTLTQPIPQASGTQFQTADLDIALTVEGDHVTGTIKGPTAQLLTQPSCPSDTVAPGQTTAEVEGTLSGGVLQLEVVSAVWDPPTVDPCPGGGMPGLIGETTASGIEGFEESLRRLELADDGSYRYEATETIPAAAPFTVEYLVVVEFDE